METSAVRQQRKVLVRSKFFGLLVSTYASGEHEGNFGSDLPIGETHVCIEAVQAY